MIPVNPILDPVRFTIVDAERAYKEWGANCGPSAVAAVLGMTLDEIRPHMGDFERKHYTNPTLMWEVLRNTGARWSLSNGSHDTGKVSWPNYGLARVQWEGPWTEPGVPIRARYWHTHWIGVRPNPACLREVFDINCLCVGGWVPVQEWSYEVVPWLLRQIEPEASGEWHLTHAVEVQL